MSATICAICTPPGVGAMAIIRVSGRQSLHITEQIFSKTLSDKASHTLHFGRVRDPLSQETIDEVVVSIFKAPHSFTGEDVVEITCHGSSYIQAKLIQILLEKGCELAKNGEFTQRAFLNGKMDLAQAEAILDLIHAQSENQHKMAIDQMKGHFSKIIQDLRNQLIEMAALIELELDFSGEDVTFADRDSLFALLKGIADACSHLMASYQTGSVLKQGIPVAIIGAPNAGKSTLLNALLGEERALVSDIAGTTRDAIEDTLNIDGVLFRIIDTAGIRETADVIESMGIEKAFAAAKKASIVLYVVDATEPHSSTAVMAALSRHLTSEKKVFVLYNKIDLEMAAQGRHDNFGDQHSNLAVMADSIRHLRIAAQTGQGLPQLKTQMLNWAKAQQQTGDFVVSSLRHFEALHKAYQAVLDTQNAFNKGLPSDLIALHLRDVINALSEVTGQVVSDDLLDRIFREFCIGK